MVVLGFQNAYVSVAYIVAMGFLGLHLTHAISSIFQTLGMISNRSRQFWHYAGVTPSDRNHAGQHFDSRSHHVRNHWIARWWRFVMREISFDLNAKTPDGPIEQKWDRHLANLKLVSPNNKRMDHGDRGWDWPGGSFCRSFGWPNWVTKSRPSLSTTALVALTVLLLREGSTRPRTIKTMVIVCGDCSMTR